MKEEEFELKVASLITTSGANYKSLVKGIKKLFSQAQQLTKPFLLTTTIQQLIEEQPEITNENLYAVLCKLVSCLEDPKESEEIASKLKETFQLLKTYDEQGTAAYLGIGVVIIATNDCFFNIFKFRRTPNYGKYINSKYSYNTELEMLQLDSLKPHRSKNCWVIPLEDSSGSHKIELVKVYPEWSTLLLTNSGQVANQFYKGTVTDRSVQVRLDKRKVKTKNAIANFIDRLQTAHKKQQIPDIKKHIHIIKNKKLEQSSFLNLLDTFSLLVELGSSTEFLNKKVDFYFNIDAKTFKSKDSVLAMVLVRLLKDAICSNYHDDLKITLELIENEFVFSLLATPNQFFSEPIVYDYNTRGVFATNNYINKIQSSINELDVKLNLMNKQGIILKTSLANIELRADYFGFYPNILTEKSTLDRSKTDFKSLFRNRLLNVDPDNPLQLSEFDQIRGELCALLFKLDIRKNNGKKSKDEENTPAEVLEQLDAIHSNLKMQCGTPRGKTVNNPEPLSMPLKKGRRRSTLLSFFVSKKEIVSKTNEPSIEHTALANSDVLSNSEIINNVTTLINSIMPYLLVPEKLTQYAAITEQTKKPIAQLIDILKNIDQQLQENNTNKKYHRKLHDLIKKMLQIYVDFAEQSKRFFHDSQPKALITGPLIGPCSIEPAIAFNLLGLNSKGERVWGEYPGASHPVTQRQGVHYKAERSLGADNGLGTGLEQFIHTFIKEFSPQHWQSMLTPVTSLRISNLFKPDHSEIEPQYLSASLTVPGMTLANWLVIKEWTETIVNRGGKASLLKALKQWITKEYYRTDESIEDMIEEIIKNHLTIDSPNRLRDFAQAPKGSDPSDRLRGNFKRILADYGEEKCRLICSFIHQWPELVSGFELFEVAKWIPGFNKLPEYFLNIPADKIKLVYDNEVALQNVIYKIYEQLNNFWKLLNTPSALALAVACLLFGFEDGNGDNFQVEIIKKKIEENGEPWYVIDEWRIFLIDVGLQAFENQIVIDKAKNDESQIITKHRAGIKCILFLLGQIQDSILADHIKLSDSVELLMLRCLEAAKIQDDEYAKYQQMELFHVPESDLGFPLKVPLNAFSDLYRSLKQLKSFLKDHPQGTWKDYFGYSTPLLAKAYELSKVNNPNSTLRAYLNVSKEYLEDILPTEDQLVMTKSQLKELIDEKQLELAEEKPREKHSQSLLNLLKSSPKKTNNNKKVCETYADALAMCVLRSRIYKKTDFERAMFELLKEFPWEEEDKRNKIMSIYSWLNILVKIYPKLPFYKLNISNYTLSPELLEWAVSGRNTEVALWLDRQNVLASSSNSKKTLEEIQREHNIKQFMRLHRLDSDVSLSTSDQAEVERITALAYQSLEQFCEQLKPLESRVKSAILNNLNWVNLPDFNYLEQRQFIKIASKSRFTRICIDGEFQNEDMLVQIIKENSEIQELTIANNKKLTTAKLLHILGACQNKLIALKLTNLSNVRGCLGYESSVSFNFPQLVKLEMKQLAIQSVSMSIPRLRELTLMSCETLTTFPTIKNKLTFLEIKGCDRLKTERIENDETVPLARLK